jgi:hypothetical protein
MALAAACMAAAVTRLPRTQTERAIAADADATSPRQTPVPETAARVAPTSAPPAGTTCTSSDDALSPEEETCVTPGIFTSAPLVTSMVVSEATRQASVTTMVSVAPRQTPLASLAPPVSLSCEERE